MILPAIALAVVTPTAGGAGDDIVVTAAKLRKIRINADSDGSGLITKCDVTVSSGDVELDRHACEATRQCAEAGIRSGEAVGDCVDQRLIAFANARHEPEIETHAAN